CTGSGKGEHRTSSPNQPAPTRYGNGAGRRVTCRSFLGDGPRSTQGRGVLKRLVKGRIVFTPVASRLVAKLTATHRSTDAIRQAVLWRRKSSTDVHHAWWNGRQREHRTERGIRGLRSVAGASNRSRGGVSPGGKWLARPEGLEPPAYRFE